MLELDAVGRMFRGGAGVRDLTLSVGPGEIVALVGLNGAGKTTLMRLALGMLRANTGTVRIAGADVAHVPAQVWRAVGHLIETPLAYPELTVRENLRIAARLHLAAADCAERAIDQWQLTSYTDRRVRRLSLGNRQRVGLAAALQHGPSLIVVDEPSNTLDPAGVLILRDALQQAAASGAAILVSSHHLDEVARIAHRIELMNRGSLIGRLDPGGADLERTFFDRVRIDDERRRDDEARSGADRERKSGGQP